MEKEIKHLELLKLRFGNRSLCLLSQLVHALFSVLACTREDTCLRCHLVLSSVTRHQLPSASTTFHYLLLRSATSHILYFVLLLSSSPHDHFHACVPTVGEEQMHFCEVMLKDFADSKRIGARILENQKSAVEKRASVSLLLDSP